ncbi:epidermal growth factor receptor substrate 15-like 1 isoform X9 [Sorex araneus]|uniref:epidermal growth factor receptor substrate 15-like 1 isoform X9 n=1 Tax=Sorex araneus TaxID=42254 RepID=UPI002433B999|nr:epidermal growth factor receptor substrate 15-like 1 isoform X9 [Sorex araneus]
MRGARSARPRRCEPNLREDGGPARPAHAADAPWEPAVRVLLQVDPSSTGRVGASEAALFLKRSGLSDAVLGKIWDLADPDGHGFLDKQGFYVALRLVACAQSGHDVSVSSLGLNVPPPKFHESTSPLMTAQSSAEPHWAVRVEEKAKFDGIFESLLPVNGLLSGDKVKPVLMNSKLPLDVLGRVWDLSDIDKDGHLDRGEFAVAMHLVYRALEKEPVPAVLPPSLIPPAKRKKSVFVGAVPVLPASPPPRDSLRSTPSHGSVSSLNSAGSLSPKPGLKPAQPPVSWVVPVADKLRFDEIFLKTDLDLDGYVSGQEAKDIFLHSGLPQSLLAHIWALADTRQTGKLSQEQFALAMHLIQQKVSRGLDPPQVLSPDMVPPSERGTPGPDSSGTLGSTELTGVAELDDISQEIAQLQREKHSLEQDIREKEEAIRQKTTEVQELQKDLDREASGLQELEAQKQEAQGRLDEMDQQKAKLRGMLGDVRRKCQEETQTISSLKTQIQSQESDLKSQEDDVNRARSELARLQQEEAQLEQSIQAGRAQLETILRSLQATQDEIVQARNKLSQIHDSQHEARRSLEQLDLVPNSLSPGAELGEGSVPDRAGFGAMATRFRATPLWSSHQAQQTHLVGTHSERATRFVAPPLTTSARSRPGLTPSPPTPSPNTPYQPSLTPSSPGTPSPELPPKAQAPLEFWTRLEAAPLEAQRASPTSATWASPQLLAPSPPPLARQHSQRNPLKKLRLTEEAPRRTRSWAVKARP